LLLTAGFLHLKLPLLLRFSLHNFIRELLLLVLEIVHPRHYSVLVLLSLKKCELGPALRALVRQWVLACKRRPLRALVHSNELVDNIILFRPTVQLHKGREVRLIHSEVRLAFSRLGAWLPELWLDGFLLFAIGRDHTLAVIVCDLKAWCAADLP
jgi:hypothetical protein